MSYDSTTWAPDAETQASSSTSAALNNATLSGTLTVSGATQLSTLTLSQNTIKDSAGDARIVMDASANTVEVRNASFLIQNVDNESPYPIIKSDPDNDLHSISLAGTGYATDTLQIGRDDGGHAILVKGATNWGVDGTGYDIKFYGDTSGSYMLWDESDDALELTDSTPLKIGDGGDMTIYHDGSHSYVTNATGTLKLATETSGIAVSIGHTTSVTTINDELDITGTVDINDATDASNSTTGALKVDGGVGIAKKLFVGSDLDVDGAAQINGTLTVGADTDGHDVLFWGGSSGKFMQWDESANELLVSGKIRTAYTGAASIIKIGIHTDGYDRHLNFMHGTINTLMGIDDSTDNFIIRVGGVSAGTPDFNSTLADNSLTIDASHNVGIAGDLTVHGNNISGSGGSIITFNGDDVELADNLSLNTDYSYIYLGDGSQGDVWIKHRGDGIEVASDRPSGDSQAVSKTVLEVQHSTQGTPEAGFGAAISYNLESLGGQTTGMYLKAIMTDVTDGNEDCDFVVNLEQGGTTSEKMRLTSAGDLAIDGDLTVTGNNISGSGGTLITFSGDDIKFPDDVQLVSDAAYLKFGTNSEVKIFHVHNEGIQLQLDTATDDTVIDMLQIQRTTSGTAATGIGAAIEFRIQTASGGTTTAGRLQFLSANMDGGTINADCQIEMGTTKQFTLFNGGGIQLENEAFIALKEISTPTAVTDYGKVYTKNDNKLYFQDGEGTEYTVDITAV